jgi:hypothetical protein
MFVVQAEAGQGHSIVPRCGVGATAALLAFQGMDGVVANLANNVPQLRGKVILSGSGLGLSKSARQKSTSR